ncbi:hypothetical protein ABZ671_00725 [Micromonospora sp. NPDC006766]|uniref:hypothetical protein n=1 Tax=Micromonospora sp. NPDC006766 TaxID=3154778 RepID=UPI0033D0A200
MTDTTRPCISDTHCKGYDRTTRQPAWTGSHRDPYCDPCLAAASRDLGTLLYDWLDLEQQQMPTLSQAPSGQPNRHRDPPMPLRGAPEALQREIHHALTTWETEVRAVCRLADLPALTRQGPAVQRAITILRPRIRLLAALPATDVYPTGCEDQPTAVTGWEAVQHLQRLRARARAMLGWTHRSRWVPGDCWACDGRDTDDLDGPLYRAEPRYEGDESLVFCDRCQQHRSEADYDTYLLTLRWPGAPDPADEQADNPEQAGDTPQPAETTP